MIEQVPHWPAAAIWVATDLSPEETSIEPRAWQFRASDGYDLAVLSYPSARPEALGHIVMIHGVQSHAGWYQGLGRRLAAAGYDCSFPDRRGSGANQVARGHARSAARLLDDLTELLAHLKSRPDGEQVPLTLGGISWGGKLAVVASARRPDLVDRLILLCPGLHPRVKISTREKIGVALAMATGRSATRRFPIPLADPALFTDNPHGRTFIANDPLSLRTATAGLFFASRVIDSWVKKAPGGIAQPVLLVLAEHDRVVDNARTRHYLDSLVTQQKELVELRSAQHTPEFDQDARTYVHAIIDWLRRLRTLN
jgi:alpha-beta hydrolase superfamily lysophospholipase